MPFRPIRCVVFDWGGVILKHHRSWAEACGAAGIEVRAGHENPELVAQRRRLNQQFQSGELAGKEFFPALAAATANLYSQEEVERIHHAWLTEEYAGMEAVVKRLLATPKIETALLSNTNAAHWERLKDFPIAGLLKHRHASHLLGHAKPSPAIFKAFEAATGFRGTDILFFDDLPDNIVAAHAAGWHAELIDHTGDTAEQVVRHLTRYEVW